MIPLLPSNPKTITPRDWSHETVAQCEDRLDQLRKLDTFERTTNPYREAEKSILELQIQKMNSSVAQVLTKDDERTWKELCLKEYEDFVNHYPVPLPCSFLSGSAWFDAGADHANLWLDRIKKVGDQFWSERGYCVDWDASTSSKSLTIKPLEQISLHGYPKMNRCT